jgi:hypothetical protein
MRFNALSDRTCTPGGLLPAYKEHAMTRKEIEAVLDQMQTNYINYQIKAVKNGKTPLTFVEWIKAENAKARA